MLIFGGLLLPVCRLVCSFGQFLQPGDVRGRVQYGIYCSPRVIYTYCPRTAIYYIPPWYGIYCAGGAFDTPTQWDTNSITIWRLCSTIHFPAHNGEFAERNPQCCDLYRRYPSDGEDCMLSTSRIYSKCYRDCKSQECD